MPNVDLIRAYGVGSFDWLALLDGAFIFSVCSSPEPNKVITAFDGKRPYPWINASRPESSDFLKMQRRM
jgi:hypothetical protein